MDILDIAGATIIYRGYNYFKEGNVISYTKLSDFEYEGYVEGTNPEPYNKNRY